MIARWRMLYGLHRRRSAKHPSWRQPLAYKQFAFCVLSACSACGLFAAAPLPRARQLDHRRATITVPMASGGAG